MSSWFTSLNRSPGKRAIFGDKDILSLIQTFPVDGTGLVPLRSSEQLVTKGKLSDELGELIENGEGRVSCLEASDRLDVDLAILQDIIQESGGRALTTGLSDYILTKSEQSSILDALQQLARSQFVDLRQFALDRDLEPTSALFIAESATDSRGQLYNLTGLNYFHAPQLRKQLTDTIASSLTHAYDERVSCEWSTLDFKGLAFDDFVRIVREVIDELDSVKGILSLDHHSPQVTFIPDSLEQRKRQELLQKLRVGELRIYSAHGGLPGLSRGVDNSESTFKFIKENSVQPAANDAPVLILSTHAVSALALRGIVSSALDSLEDGKPVPIKSILQEYPSAIHDLLEPKIQAVATKIYPTEDYRVIGNHFVSTRWLASVTQTATDLTVQLAKRSFDAKETQKSKLVVSSAIKKRLAQSIEAQPPLLDALWADGKSQLSIAAYKTFTSTVDDLEHDVENEFVELWTTRVVEKARLHYCGLDTIPAGKLKTELETLLADYVSNELVPGAVNRSREKGLLRPTKRRFSESANALVAAVLEKAEDGCLKDVMETLECFNIQLGIPPPDADSTGAKKILHLSALVAGLYSDSDGPRHFITLLIILLARTRDGIVYATGKFAPRLLKLIKPALRTKQLARLEDWKEACKKGNVDAETLNAMRTEASKALMPEEEDSSEQDETNEDDKGLQGPPAEVESKHSILTNKPEVENIESTIEREEDSQEPEHVPNARNEPKMHTIASERSLNYEEPVPMVKANTVIVEPSRHAEIEDVHEVGVAERSQPTNNASMDSTNAETNPRQISGGRPALPAATSTSPSTTLTQQSKVEVTDGMSGSNMSVKTEEAATVVAKSSEAETTFPPNIKSPRPASKSPPKSRIPIPNRQSPGRLSPSRQT